MKSWIKGGIIGVVIVMIIIIVSITFSLNLHPSLIATSDSYQTPMVSFFIIPEWFVYGAIIGWIYGKFKSK